MSAAARPNGQANGLATNGHAPESANMRAIKEAFRATTDEGIEAGVESLLALADEDCEFRPYTAGGGVLRGHDEVRRFYREAVASGVQMRLKPSSFEELGDAIVVNGTMRVARPSGGFSESQMSWTYRFSEGRLTDAAWGPRSSG